MNNTTWQHVQRCDTDICCGTQMLDVVVHACGMPQCMHAGHYKTLTQNHCGTFCATCIIAVTTAVVSVVETIKPTQNTIQSQNNAKERCRAKFGCAIHVQNVCPCISHTLFYCLHFQVSFHLNDIFGNWEIYWKYINCLILSSPKYRMEKEWTTPRDNTAQGHNQMLSIHYEIERTWASVTKHY